MSKSFDFLNSKINIDTLRFLADNAGIANENKVNLVKHIISGTGYSRKGVYDALKKLISVDLVLYRQIGKSKVYELNNENPVIKQFKVLKTVIELGFLTEKLREKTKKIILYGSASRGDDGPGSDIDLAIIADEVEHEGIKDDIQKIKLKKKISAEFFTPFKFVELEKNDRIYYLEIDRGIVLWEEHGE